MNIRNIIVALVCVVMMCGMANAQENLYKKREMRGVWVATVANIDWPPKGKSAEEQKAALVGILDSLAAANINAVFFQVRPTADAFYASDLEPWSIYLTGRQGEAPEGGFDPLAVMVEEGHKRCIEVHAWINPYRVTNGESEDKLAPRHIYRRRPELFVKYGGKIYFNPGLQETRDYLTSVVMDIVLRYDVDGVHMDDYFYPYKVQGAEFPDLETFRAHNRGIYDRKEWRRDNVNLVVEQIDRAIHAAKPWVSFGVSPFGIWRNDYDDLRGSATATTCTNYDELSADVLKWLEKGWIDYAAPQLYWEIGRKNLDYGMLSEWWSKYTFGKNLYIGLYASGLSVKTEEAWKTPNEVIRQMQRSRGNKNVAGYIFYSCKYFLGNTQGILDSLRTDFFAYKALPPADTTMLKAKPSAAPKNLRIITEKGRKILRWSAVEKKGGFAVDKYAVYAFRSGEEINIEKPEKIISITAGTEIDLSELSYGADMDIVVTSINRFRLESKPSKATKFRKQ